MAITISKEKRSYIMSKIRSKDTKPELMVRRHLHANGFRYRIHNKNLPGSPDIVLTKYKTVIFVHGCFWHHHIPGCRDGVIPKSNKEYWERKIKRNLTRDIRSQIELSRMGWESIVIWECELKKDKTSATLAALLHQIKENALRHFVIHKV